MQCWIPWYFEIENIYINVIIGQKHKCLGNSPCICMSYILFMKFNLYILKFKLRHLILFFPCWFKLKFQFFWRNLKFYWSKTGYLIFSEYNICSLIHHMSMYNTLIFQFIITYHQHKKFGMLISSSKLTVTIIQIKIYYKLN